MKKWAAVLGAVALALAPAAVWADSDWYNSFVILNSNGGGNTYYDLNGTTGNPDLPASLGTFNTTSGNTLVLVGGEGQGVATPGQNWYAADSFVLNYRVYKQGDAAPAYTPVSLTNGGWQYQSGWDYWKYDNTGVNASLVGPATANGTYNLDIVMSKKDYWNTGNYTSYIPGGQAQGSFPSTSYQTTFTVIPEPATVGLLALFGAAAVMRRRMRLRRK